MGAGGTDLPHVTPISDPVVAGILERVVELVDGATARRSMARQVAMGFTGVFMWHARCIVSAACFCARLGEAWVPRRLPRWEFTSRWHFLVLGWLKQAALPRAMTKCRLHQALCKRASMPNGGASCNTRNRGAAYKKVSRSVFSAFSFSLRVTLMFCPCGVSRWHARYLFFSKRLNS